MSLFFKDECEYLECNETFTHLVISEINKQLKSFNPFFQDYFHKLGCGKLLRTRFLASFNPQIIKNQKTIDLAAAIEMLHTASLLHDDVLDKAQIRRGSASLWKISSASCAILTGDILMSKAIFIVNGTDPLMIAPFLKAIETMCEGELEQDKLKKKKPTKSQLIEIAGKKTGELFALSAQCSKCSDRILMSVLQTIGRNIGIAYQLYDDLLDEFGNPVQLKKDIYQDKNNGKYTIAHGKNALKNGLKMTQTLINKSLEAIEPWQGPKNGLVFFLKNYFWGNCTLN